MRRSDDRPSTGATNAATNGATAITRALSDLSTAVDTVAEIDLDAVPTSSLTDVVATLSRLDGRLDGVTARFVTAAEAAGVPEASGAASTTSWLAETTGRNHGQSARTSRMAKAVGDAPAIGEALSTGRVGPDQAATIASALDRGVLTADDTDDLLREAEVLPPSAFSRETKRREHRRDQAQLRRDERLAHERRSLNSWRSEDGSLHLEGRFAPAAGDVIQTALQSLVVPDGAEVPDEARRTPRQLRADALHELCDHALRTETAGTVGGVRPHVTVTVPVEAMAPTLEEAEGLGATGESSHGTTHSAAAIRKVLCDATVRRVVIGTDSQPVDIGRARRQWPTSMRAAIAAVDGGCRAPGSDLPPERCVVHHVTWWENGGETSVDNGVMLSHHGHSLIHDEGWTLQVDPTTRICTWTTPDGTTHTTHPRGPAARGRGARTSRPPPDTADPPDGSAPPGGHDPPDSKAADEQQQSPRLEF